MLIICLFVSSRRLGETPLMKAAYFGHVAAIVQLLLDASPIGYENEYNGKTALHYAAEGNQPASVALLLQVRCCLLHTLADDTCTAPHVVLSRPRRASNCLQLLSCMLR
jgi:ankyrin repeat protein